MFPHVPLNQIGDRVGDVQTNHRTQGRRPFASSGSACLFSRGRKPWPRCPPACRPVAIGQETPIGFGRRCGIAAGVRIAPPLSPSLFTQSSLFGIGIAFSPLHIGVVTLLLLGRNPLRRSLAYVLGWTLANVLAVTLLMLVGSEFAISLEHGAREQVLIDLLGAGGLLALGLYQLTPQATIGEEGMALRLMNRLPEAGDLLLVLLGAGGALLTPENLVFYLKEAGLLLINHPGLRADVEITGLYALMASSLMLLPPLAWVLSSGAIREPIVRLEEWLQHRAESLVGVLALLIAAYLLYEGIHGLETMMAV